MPAVPAKKAVPREKATSGRRSSVEITQDDWILLEYVRAHAGQRGEEIGKSAGLPKDRVASGLKRLRKAGRVRIHGVKRGATYAAASRARPANGGEALQGQVLELIAKRAALRAEEITKRLGAKPEHVKAALAALRESGKVKVSGRARGTSYSVA